MLTSHSLLAWTALAIALVLAPGPDTILVAGYAARRGVRAGVAAALGVFTGGIWYMALCGFGFLAILNAVPGVFLAVKVVGAVYLAWLGIKLLRGAVRPGLQTGEGAVRPLAGRAPFVQGLLTTVLNPKVAVFFLAALPQFVGTGPMAPLHGVLLVAIVYGIGFCWLMVLVTAASRAGVKVGQSSALRWIEGVLGVAFVGFASKLAFSRN